MQTAASRVHRLYNRVLACPFGVPKMNTTMHLMMKCGMCDDRTSVGKSRCAPRCVPPGAVFGTRDVIERLRPQSRPLNTFKFGAQIIKTRVNMMVPARSTIEHLDRGCRAL